MQSTTNQQPAATRQQQPQVQSQLKHLNFDLTEIYFPLLVLQMRYDIFALRNRTHQKYNSDHNNQNQFQHLYEQLEDDNEVNHEYQRQFYETPNKQWFFILRDQFLLTKISITGTVVFQIRKEDRVFFGIDDSTGVMICVLWFNESSAQSSGYGRRESNFRLWLTDNNIGIGSVLTVLGQLEYFKDKLQVNVHKLRQITDLSEEMLQYQQTISSQQCFFDPFKPFQRRIFNTNQQQEQPEREILPQPVIQKEKSPDQVLTFSVSRIKKQINDFILNNYQSLFRPVSTEKSTELQPLQAELQKITLTQDDIINHSLILAKVEAELKYCDQQNKPIPQDLIKECLVELEAKGFLNLVGNTVNQYVVQIREQKQKLKHFISNTLRSTKKGQSFELIYKAVCQQFDNFYTKEFVFKVIDELHQMGVLYETANCVYASHDNQS